MGKQDGLEKYNFQYCQKIVVFSSDMKKVLLCKRRGENDYDGTYSFIGGKMEVSDDSLILAMEREKNEEVGSEFKIKVYTDFSHNLIFKKRSGDYMILPHYFAKYVEGDIVLNEEYSEYAWVLVEELDNFEPKIESIPDVVNKLLKFTRAIEEVEFKII